MWAGPGLGLELGSGAAVGGQVLEGRVPELVQGRAAGGGLSVRELPPAAI